MSVDIKSGWQVAVIQLAEKIDKMNVGEVAGVKDYSEEIKALQKDLKSATSKVTQLEKEVKALKAE